MSLQRIKALVWLASLVVGTLLGWVVADFLRHKSELQQYVSEERHKAVLVDQVQEPELPQDDRVDTKLLNEVFFKMNWTGKEEVKPVEVAQPTVAEEAPKTPVADLLNVLVIQVDTRSSKGSLAYVNYVDPDLERLAKGPEANVLRIGSRLKGKYRGVRVEDITVEGVKFAFDEEGREPEVVAAMGYPEEHGAIVVVADGGAILPDVKHRITFNADYVPYRPKETVLVGRNTFQIGTETVRDLDRDYSRILSQDVQYRTARDPSTGKVKGIQITKVAPGSLPAQHGLTEGEVVKSINGHPVTSVNDAIAYVKKEAPTTNEWVVVFEKYGKEFTRTYKSPPPE